MFPRSVNGKSVGQHIFVHKNLITKKNIDNQHQRATKYQTSVSSRQFACLKITFTFILVARRMQAVKLTRVHIRKLVLDNKKLQTPI